MPAESVAQQHMMGMVHAVQKGDMPMSKLHSKAKSVAEHMDPESVKDFASTSTAGLPEHKKASLSLMMAMWGIH